MPKKRENKTFVKSVMLDGGSRFENETSLVPFHHRYHLRQVRLNKEQTFVSETEWLKPWKCPTMGLSPSLLLRDRLYLNYNVSMKA